MLGLALTLTLAGLAARLSGRWAGPGAAPAPAPGPAPEPARRVIAVDDAWETTPEAPPLTGNVLANDIGG